jgi:hypothetical protein
VTTDWGAGHQEFGPSTRCAFLWLMLALSVRPNTIANPETSAGSFRRITPKSASRSSLLLIRLSSSGILRRTQRKQKSQSWPTVSSVTRVLPSGNAITWLSASPSTESCSPPTRHILSWLPTTAHQTANRCASTKRMAKQCSSSSANVVYIQTSMAPRLDTALFQARMR